ncbi:alpha/beta fold hydrolase [Nocardioidaceae bacterium]|nr:alpha/beta fold hydrolase [Nocardioidaceae bacterium]
MPSTSLELQHVTIHGHRRAYVKAGSGPALLLLHGLACDHTTWLPVIEQLAKKYTVIAPDLLGHGESAKPRADYSVGGYANGMRDLLTVLGIEQATVVGHSLGGGVAMQFGYQFPERTSRMILVAPGGIGPEVTAAIRLLTVPGAESFLRLATMPGVRHLGVHAIRRLASVRSAHSRDLAEVADIFDSFKDRHARAAVRHVIRAAIDWRGQVITMADRAYLTSAMPMCVIWGADDMVIPVRHAAIAREIAPSAQVEVIANAGHFPHKDHPERVVKIMKDFIRSTEPAVHEREMWRDLLLHGPGAPAVREGAGDRPLTPVSPIAARRSGVTA